MTPFAFHYAKPVYAALVAFLGALGTALADDEVVTALEWVTIATATIVAAGAVFGVAGTEDEAAG